NSEKNFTNQDILNRINLLISEGKITEAENYFIGKKEYIKDIPFTSYIEGLLELNKNNHSKALAIFSVITDSYTDSDIHGMHSILALKGNIYRYCYNDSANAAKEFEKAYQLEKNIIYLNVLAECYLNLGKINIAEQKLIQAKAINSRDAGYLATSSKYNRYKKNFEIALQEIEEAILIEGYNPSFLVEKSFVLDSMGDIAGAIESCKKAYQIDNKFKSALYNLANYHIKNNDIIQAEIEIKQYRKSYPQDIVALGTYFYILYNLGNSKQVIREGKSYLIEDIAKHSHEALNTLGLCYLINKELAKAEECYSCLLSIYPNHVTAMQGMFYVNFLDKESRDLEKAN
ncbi:MAG: tetratricopeptide repeat protein, partial [Rickettsiales bacterium]